MPMNELTDEEIDRLAQSEGLSDDQIEQMSMKAADAIKAGVGGVGRGVGAITSAVGKGLQYVDAFSPVGAPMRAAIGAYQEGKPALEAYGKQYGEDPSKAPTYGEMLEKAGVSNAPIMTIKPEDPFSGPAIKAGMADIGGTLADFATDPTTYLGGGAAVKGAEMAAKGASKLSPKVAAYLARKAEEKAAKALTGTSVSRVRKLAKATPKGAGDLQELEKNLLGVGRSVLEADEAGAPAMGLFDNAGNVAQKAKAKSDFYGAKIGATDKRIDALKPEGAVSGPAIADDIIEIGADLPPVAGGIPLQDQLLHEAGLVANKATTSGPVPRMLGVGEARKYKGRYQYSDQAKDSVLSSKDATNKINQVYERNIEKSILENSTPQQYAEYIADKAKFGSYKTAGEGAGAEYLQEFARRNISPSSHGIGAATMVADAAAGGTGAVSAGKGLLASLANQFALERGNSTAAVILDRIGKALEKAGPAADKWTPAFKGMSAATAEGFLLKHKLLMQADPEYREIITRGAE